MSTGYKIAADESLYYLTLQIVGWVDIFTRKHYRDIVVESLEYCRQHKGLEIYAYVIMSNHIHLLVQSRLGDLSGCIRDFKRHTSKKFFEVIESTIESRRDWLKVVFGYYGQLKLGQTFQIWTHENHAEQIYSQKFIEQKLNYIHNNPVRSGIVAKPEDYLYSSARNYADMENVLAVTKLVVEWKTY
jgi:REP element-mobilizing transposase RayT